MLVENRDISPELRQFSKRIFPWERRKIAAEIAEKLWDAPKSTASGSQEALAIRNTFYENQARAFQERNVADVSRKYAVFFVHGILQSVTPQPNSLIKQGVTWREKLLVALSLNPTLTASSVKPGDTNLEMWSRMGLIVSGGAILGAHQRDGESRIRNIHDRNLQRYDLDIPIDEAIRKAILERDESEERRLRLVSDYNEFTVFYPQFSGFYVCMDRDTGGRDRESWLETRDPAPLGDIVSMITELGLPLFVIKGGLVYEGIQNPDGQDISNGRAIPMEEIISRRYALTFQKRRNIIGDLLDHNPFKTSLTERPESFIRLSPGGNPENRLGSPYSEYVDSRFHGRQLYIYMNAWSDFIVNACQDYIDVDDDLEKSLRRNRIPIVEKVKLLAQIEQPNDIYGGTLFYIAVKDSAGKNRVFGGAWEVGDIYSEGNGVNYIWIGHNNSLDTKQGIKNNFDYLQEMASIIQQGISVIENPRFVMEPWERKQKIFAYLTVLAFHLFGFGEQAEKCKDYQTAKQAFAVAGRVISHEEYKRIVEERVGIDGKFRLKEEDLRL